MIYLTQLVLNARHREVQRDLSDCHNLHCTVLRAFTKAPEGYAARDYFKILHRIEEVQRPRTRTALLVQSATEPDWTFIPSGYLEPGTLPAVKRVDDVYDSIPSGSVLRFRLRANPTKRVWAINDGADERWKGKRVELRREEDQIAWLIRKGDVDREKSRGGFDLLDVSIRADGVQHIPAIANVSVISGDTVHGRRRGTRLTFGSVLFNGVLRVTDVTAFKGTLTNGIGSGKAYGFGLLSIGPA